MYIAEQLQKKNRAEYILYLWQIEDTIRAFDCDFDKLKANYLSRFDWDEEQRTKAEKWYEDLCCMMHEEGVTKSGHLQITKGVMSNLEELHDSLLKAEGKYPDYRAAYMAVLPFIVELRSKYADKPASELETCLNATYAVALMRMQGKTVSEGTLDAIKKISNMLSLLSSYWLKDKTEPLEF